MAYEFYTPPDVVDAGRNILQGSINFDPASCTEANQFVCAENFVSLPNNGLLYDWSKHERVWVNPPYKDIGLWVDKALLCTSKVVILLPSSTDTKWFWKLVNYGAQIWLSRGRVLFHGPSNKGIKGRTGYLMAGIRCDNFNDDFYAGKYMWSKIKF